MTITRYDPAVKRDGKFSGMWEMEDGDYVLHTDLTAIERAAYERGVRDAAAQVADTCPHADVPGGNCTPDTFDEGTSAAYKAILAILTQEGR